VIDGKKACSMIYTVTGDQSTQKDLDVSFDTDKQYFLISVTGPANNFDKYLPIVSKMLDPIKAP
jgi:hypothetical protein